MAKKQVTENQEEVSAQVTFSPEQLAVVNSLIEKAVKSNKPEGSEDKGISVYGLRDPKTIETVNVNRFDGKFVIGFKNVQKDPFKKEPLYIEYAPDPIRKLNREPYITLILSDGTDTEERKVLLVDYYEQRRNKYQAKVVDIKVEKIIEDHGLLGGSSGMAREIDASGKTIQRPVIKAQSMREKRTFLVELPGFSEPVEFADDFKGPLA